MTTPAPDDMMFLDQSRPGSVMVGEPPPSVDKVEPSLERFPPPILDVDNETKDKFIQWMDTWLEALINDQNERQTAWGSIEEGYRALKEGPKRLPYEGADRTVIPVMAMAVDPIHARLDTGIFKQDPVFQFKGLKKSILPFIPALSAWVDYYQKHKLKLRRVANPRLMECVKLGTCVFKTVYDHQNATIKTYDKMNWKVIEKDEVRYSGPRVFGISLGDFLFPARYQFIEDCPIVAERIRTTWLNLKVAEASKKLANVDSIKGQEEKDDTALETARADAAGHHEGYRYQDDLIVYEVWCDYDINNDGLPEHLVATYHRGTRTLLQLRYNWYFHQRKPYTVIPYTVTNDSLYGIGCGEMTLPFQEALTKWHQMATDNAYLANIRMFIMKKNSGIEEVPRLYAGRCFVVDDPRSDFIPFASADIYPSTLSERQNLFGMVEKRTGVSDYLTGRESPIIGTRATATSTLALIQEGTKRVEEVLENIRNGFAEVIENCIYIWIQYGLEGLDETVFGDDEIGKNLKALFDTLTEENVNGALAIDLSATDAAGNRQAMQQMQLQIIQIMMQYLEKLLAAGQAALQAQQQMPQMTEMIADVMTASRNMFRDLLMKYDIRNPDAYLPDLEKYLNANPATTVGPDQFGAGGAQAVPNGAAIPPGMGRLAGSVAIPGAPGPATPGQGNGFPGAVPPPGFPQG
jgi:hypothetical protein